MCGQQESIFVPPNTPTTKTLIMNLVFDAAAICAFFLLGFICLVGGSLVAPGLCALGVWTCWRDSNMVSQTLADRMESRNR